MANALSGSDQFRVAISELNGCSKQIISSLTILSEKYKDVASEIVGIIVHRTFKAERENHLSHLYLLDSIIKNVGEPYITLVNTVVTDLFIFVFKKADEKVRYSLYKLFLTWVGIVGPSYLQAIATGVKALDPKWPISDVFEFIKTKSNKSTGKKQSDFTQDSAVVKTAPTPSTNTSTNNIGESSNLEELRSENQLIDMQLNALNDKQKVLEETKKLSPYNNSNDFDNKNRKRNHSPLREVQPLSKGLKEQDYHRDQTINRNVDNRSQGDFYAKYPQNLDIGSEFSDQKAYLQQQPSWREYDDLRKYNTSYESIYRTNMRQDYYPQRNQPYVVPGEYYTSPVYNRNVTPLSEAHKINNNRYNNVSSVSYCSLNSSVMGNKPAPYYYDPNQVNMRFPATGAINNSLPLNATNNSPKISLLDVVKDFVARKNQTLTLSNTETAKISSNPLELLKNKKFLLLRDDKLINSLFEGKPCSNCGIRFREDSKHLYSEHLDQHFRENLRKSEKSDHYGWRQFYMIDDTWPVKTKVEESNDTKEITTKPTSSCIASTNMASETCTVCNDKFETFWNIDKREWHYKNAVRVNGIPYHEYCYQIKTVHNIQPKASNISQLTKSISTATQNALIP